MRRTVIIALVFSIIWIVMFSTLEHGLHVTEYMVYAVGGAIWGLLYQLVFDIWR